MGNGNESLSPITGDSRLDQLDVLRGFALLGILLVNFEYFLQPVQSLVLAETDALVSADGVVGWLIKTLAEGKFYALFSLLFGAGFALMMERGGAEFWPVYLRRLVVLLAFGLVHMLFVWSGDILLIYALVALFMVLAFRKTPARRLPKWALAFLVLPLLASTLGTLAIGLAPAEEQAALQQDFAQQLAAQRELVAAAYVAQAEGSWSEMNAQRASDLVFMLVNLIFWVPPILAYFLIGRWLIVTGRLRQPEAHPRFYRLTQRYGLALGLPLSALGAWLAWDLELIVPTPRMALASLVLTIGAPLLAFGYLSTVVQARQRLAWLAPAGRMALTNYLTQSLVWTWLIYGYGLGLGEVLPYWSTPLLVAGFFAVQVAFSHWWLARFRFGPAEWLWRSLTYLSPQPMRR